MGSQGKPGVKQRQLLITGVAELLWNLRVVCHEMRADIVLVELRAVHHPAGTGDEVQGAL